MPMHESAHVCQLPSPMGVRPDLLQAIHVSRSTDSALHDSAMVDEWIQRKRETAALTAMLTPLEELDHWLRQPQTGNICHTTGRFFSVIGLHCRHRLGRRELEWDQPIIEQPETGILGILGKVIDGVMHFCLQAKEEPGNIGGIQLSPTVQATYSNYTCAHGGAPPPFLSHFMEPAPERIIFARMQSEDGGRFLYKSNRNMIIDAGDNFPLELPDGFIWLTLRQISHLLNRDNIVNACARSILSGLVFSCSDLGIDKTRHLGKLQASEDIFQHDVWETLQWLDDRRASNHMLARRIGLNELQEWGLDNKGFFSHQEQRFFRIVGMRISAADREVRSWCQPIIENPSSGVIGLLMRNSPNGFDILMQAKAEVGNRTTVQLGPTVQFTQANYADSRKLKKPFLFDEFLAPKAFKVIHESRQAEEGARFYRECHVHRILLLPDTMDLSLPDDYRWLPLSQVQLFVHLGEQVNSCARSILTCLL